MVNFSFLSIVLIGVIFLVVPTYQRGNLYVDTIYSSAGDVITIDTLEGTDASVTDSAADTVQFQKYQSVSINAQSLSLSGSFGLIEGSTVSFTSSTGSATLYAGNNLYVNGDSITINSQGTDVAFTASNGEINSVSGYGFETSSRGFNIQTEVGGVLLNSQGGDISIESSGNLIINSKDELNIFSTYDLEITTPKDITFNSVNGTADVASLQEAVFSAESSISITANNDLISFNSGDNIIMNSNGFGASGSGSLKVQSFTGSLRFNSFDTTSFTSNSDLTIQGESKGVSMFSTGATTGIIQLTSSTKSIYFTSEGKGDENTGILVNVDSVNAVVNRTSTFFARGDGIIRSNGDATFSASGAIISNTTGNVDIDGYSVSTTSSTGFTLSSNDIFFQAFDQATSGNTLGLIDVSATNVRFNTRNNETIHGGDVDFLAGLGDLTLSGADISFYARRGENSQHSINLSGNNLSFSGKDGIFLVGGNVDLIANQHNIVLTGALTASTPIIGPGSTISSFASDDITYRAPLGGLTSVTTGSLTFESFYANGDSGNKGIVFSSVGSTIFQSSIGFDISYFSKGPFSSISTQQTIFQGYLADYTVTDDFEVFSVQANLSANEFNFQSGYLDIGVPVSSQNLTYSVTLQISRDLLITTPRNENGDDSIIAKYDSLTFIQSNLFMTGLEQGLFSSNSFDGYAVNQFDISSDDRESINFHISSLTQSSTNSLIFQGDSTSLLAANTATIIAQTAFNSYSDQRGFLATSEGSFFQGGDQESFYSKNINVNSASGISFFVDKGNMFQTAPDSIDYYSDHGPVSISAGSTFIVDSADSIYFNTGDYDGDLFSVTATDIQQTAGNSYGLTVSDGNLSIYGTGKSVASISATDIILNGLGPVSLTTGTLTFNSQAQDVFGGDITVKSTIGDIQFDSTVSTLINSTIGSLTAQELDKTTYEILFSSGNDITITTTTSNGNVQSDSSNRLEIVAKDPSNDTSDGNVYLEGYDANFNSLKLNQFIQFSSGGLINVTAMHENFDFSSAGDAFIVAKNSAQFYGQDISHTMGGDITFNATTYSCVNISSIGEAVNFQVENSATKYYNDLEFKAKDFVYFQAGGVFTLSADGYNTKRQNEDGNTNGDLIYNEEISAVLRTRNESGNIYFDAQDDKVHFKAAEHISLTAAQREFFYALNGQTFSVESGSFKAESESGNSTWRGGHDFTVSTIDAFFYSTQNTTVLAEDAISISSNAGPVAITANSGDIYFNTYYQNRIDVTSSLSSITFNSGSSGSNYSAQGNVNTQASNSISVAGARGINLKTIVGPITFTSQSSTSFSSSEELFVNSGNDVVTNSQNNTAFSGFGVAFSSTAGDISIRSQDNIVSTSETVILQSSGTSQTGHDRVFFGSTNINYRATSTYIDAAELVQIGKTTLPTIDINAGGSSTTPGVVLDVASSTYFTSTGGAINYFSVIGTNTLSATAGANFLAEGALTVAADSMNVQALLGSVLTTALNSIVHTIDLDYTLSSDHAVYVTSTGSNTLTEGISFQHVTFLQTGILENTILTGLYSATSTGKIMIDSPNQQGGTISFEAEVGDIQLLANGAAGSLTLAAYLDIQFNSVNRPITFTGNSLKVTTTNPSDPAPITFQSESAINLPITSTFTATGDFISLNTFSGDIALSSPIITFSYTGPFISNSTEGSQYMNVTTTGTIIANEFVEFNSTLDDISATITTDFNIVATYGDFFSGNDLSMTVTTDFTTTSFYDMSFSAFDTLSIVPDSGDIVLTLSTTTENVYAETHNDLSNFVVNVNTLTTTSRSLTFKAGSSSERTDFIFNTPDLNINDFQTSIVADPTSLRTSAPIYVNSPNITQSAGAIAYTSSGDEDGLGTIAFDASSGAPTVFTASDDMSFISQNSRVQGHFINDITFIGTTSTINTNGLDSIVRFEATTSITLSSTTVSTFSEQLTRVAADSGDLSLGTTAIPTTISVTGPNDGDGTGINIHGLQSISMTNPSLAITVSAARYFAKDRLSVSGGSVSFSGNTLEIHAHNGRENFAGGGFYAPVRGSQRDFVGVHFQAPTINVNAVTDLRFEAELIQTFGSLSATHLTGLVQFNADEDFQITTTGATTITTVDNTWVANQGIVQVHTGTLTVGVNPLTTLTVNAGKDDVTGKIQFITPPTGTINAQSTTIDLHSNDNVIMAATNTLSLSASSLVSILSHRGDIAVRSVSVTRTLGHTNVGDRLYDVTYTSSNGDIRLSAGRSIRHIDHWGLGFFKPNLQPGRPAAPLSLAGDQQVFSDYNAAADCSCGVGNACRCPNARFRILQIYNALRHYGLMIDTN